MLGEWEEYIDEDINEYNWINIYLKDLSEPFGFLKHV